MATVHRDERFPAVTVGVERRADPVDNAQVAVTVRDGAHHGSLDGAGAAKHRARPLGEYHLWLVLAKSGNGVVYRAKCLAEIVDDLPMVGSGQTRGLCVIHSDTALKQSERITWEGPARRHAVSIPNLLRWLLRGLADEDAQDVRLAGDVPCMKCQRSSKSRRASRPLLRSETLNDMQDKRLGFAILVMYGLHRRVLHDPLIRECFV